jgi:hypothetical protein
MRSDQGAGPKGQKGKGVMNGSKLDEDRVQVESQTGPLQSPRAAGCAASWGSAKFPPLCLSLCMPLWGLDMFMVTGGCQAEPKRRDQLQQA